MTTGRGNVWLGWAWVVLGLSLASTFYACFAGFNFDPTDYSSDYYAARVPHTVWVMVVTVLIPVLAGAASVLSLLARPREGWRTTVGVLILALALAAVWLCVVVGLESVQQTIRFAEHSPM